MRYLALILAAAAFTLGGLATAKADCAGVTHTAQSSGTKEIVASTSGGGSTPVVVPQPSSSGS